MLIYKIKAIGGLNSSGTYLINNYKFFYGIDKLGASGFYDIAWNTYKNT